METRYLDVISEIEKQARVDRSAARLFWMLMIQIQGEALAIIGVSCGTKHKRRPEGRLLY